MQTDSRAHPCFGEESTWLSQLGQRAGFGGKEGAVCPLLTPFDSIAAVLGESSCRQVLLQSFGFFISKATEST